MVLVEKENEVPPESAMPNRAYLQLWHSTRVCGSGYSSAAHIPQFPPPWLAAQSPDSGAGTRGVVDGGAAHHAWCLATDMSTYVLISKNLYKIVVEEWDEEDATENAFSEWNDEAAIKAGATLSPSDFMDGMFELADIHTEHIDWEEYSTFLSNLLLKVTIEDPPGSGRRLLCPVGSVDHMVGRQARHKRQVDENAPLSSPLRGAKRFGARAFQPRGNQTAFLPPVKANGPPPQVTAKSRRKRRPRVHQLDWHAHGRQTPVTYRPASRQWRHRSSRLKTRHRRCSKSLPASCTAPLPHSRTDRRHADRSDRSG